MTLKDIIIKSAGILGLENLDFNSPSEPLSKLIDSAKMIVSELTLEHLPLKTKEVVSIRGGRGLYEELSRPVRQILKVKSGSKSYRTEMYPNCYILPIDVSGEMEVSYLYYIVDVGVDDELTLPPQVPAYVLATGVVSEYYYRTGMVDEALFYKTRYDYSIENLSRSLKSVYLSRRGFIW